MQEYVPHYRVPLFKRMVELAESEGIDLKVVAGTPQRKQATRRDAGRFHPHIQMRQTEFGLLGRRVTFRDAGWSTRGAALVIVEQARRNLDVYFDLLIRPSRVAVWGHGSDYIQSAGRLETWLLTTITNRAAWFFGYTPTSVNAVVAKGFPPQRTTVLWNTTDTSALRGNLNQVTESEKASFRGESTGMAVFVGALDKSKRLDFLVAAAARIAARRPGFRLTICGDGPESDQVRELERQYDWLQVRPAVTGRSLAVALSSADAIAMPGRVGLIAVDSLVSSVPIVTVDWAYHAPEYEYLDSTNSVSSANTVEDYADALENTIYHALSNERLRSGATASAELFTIEGMARRFMAGIRAALSGTR
ncbi:glycosyltransferase involved in cell wall biosynthesis [Microbacterium endophyticum]|uniref:D-inositol 3-phosphate glycosyltransferase n=1 Tax=Microbacterium endophyticum TaxID=1526412 RepID=A0A7W4V2B5_9MICO|nr:glycosyltransferase [Microbacterium endophyticum]MBB2975537.1 glycosyltransferase involved in cell wall biosynthesis [Microbacterium endophyticum]NIK35444.1 glycosyltransferase involved in cell wall biosynthesis [Microbacterium endophyticum]